MNCDVKNLGVFNYYWRREIELILNDSQHGSFLSENAIGDKHKKVEN